MDFMNYHFTSNQLLLIGFVVVLVGIIAVSAYLERRRTRTIELRARFGAEYDRAVEQHGSPSQAEATLAERAAHAETLKIRDLGATEQERFITEWYTVQSRFVDRPKEAVTEADNLVNAVLEARGYPHASFEQRAADLSVNHPRAIENYRRAHAIRLGRAEATTEDLRTALIQYRAVFDEVVQLQKAHELVSSS